jgi:hypothetical protein
VRFDRQLQLHCGAMTYPRSVKFAALGAGQDIAIGAMDMGANARKACAIAMKRNFGTRGKVAWLKVSRGNRGQQ